jgi:polyphosphate kinase
LPIRDPLLQQRVRQEILEVYLADNGKARILQRDGTYVRAAQLAERGRVAKTSAAFNAQEFLISLAEGKTTLVGIPAAPARRTRAGVGKES